MVLAHWFVERPPSWKTEAIVAAKAKGNEERRASQTNLESTLSLILIDQGIYSSVGPEVSQSLDQRVQGNVDM